MSIRDSEEELFAEWRAKRPGFVSDGVVHEDTYLQSSRKLLFVLKEVNSPGVGDWDLRDFLKRGDRPQTWDNVTRWVEGIRRLTEDIPWIDFVKSQSHIGRMWLSLIWRFGTTLEKETPYFMRSSLVIVRHKEMEDND